MISLLFLLVSLLQPPPSPHSAVVVGHSDQEALIYLLTVGKSDRQPPDTVTTFDCRTLIEKHVLVIQADSYVQFENCTSAKVERQGISGWLFDEGVTNLIGSVRFTEPVRLTFIAAVGDKPISGLEGMRLWVKPVPSIRHAVVVDAEGNYELPLPAGGIHVLEAWSPKYGQRSFVTTIFGVGRVNWDWNKPKTKLD